MVKGYDVVKSEDLAEMFAEMFQTKIWNLASNPKIGPNVHNGMQKIEVEEKNFMTEDKVREAIQSIKLKNCEGLDRIPQRLLVDGLVYLIKPFAVHEYAIQHFQSEV